ncbi:hypothetical protein HAX54_042371 [Datura stramonium]|uniref:RRM domain-containing protein n=1 Tax=Datura stramonium TaxID=4076 RepID=A0ABS8VZL2_DATST|nr:hypothetical protein [Datura stramonium]
MEDLDRSKLFCGGIPRDTSEQILKEHFSKYGTVVSSVIAKDRGTGRPRGFAFVTFSDPSAVDLALQGTHEILGRTVEVKKAIPRSEQHQNQQQNSSGLNRNSRTNGRSNDQFRTKKIFVGGLSANLTQEDFKSYFERFGRITDVVVMHDNVTHRPRGFGFITFDSEDAVEEVMQKIFHELSGKLVEVKRAIPKDGNNNSGNGYNYRIGNGNSSNYNNTYQQGMYPSYSPRYVYCPGPVSGYGSVAEYPYGVGTFVGSYPVGAYPELGYGITSLMPRGPWNIPTMAGLGGSPLPYGNTGAVYPAYMNGGIGVMNMATNRYGGILGAGINEKHGQVSVRDTQGVSD